MTPAQLRQLASKIRTLLDGDTDKKRPPLSTKEDLLALFCVELGFSRAERSFSATDSMLWGGGEAARLAATAKWEVLAEHGNAGRGGFAVIYGEFPKKHFQTSVQAVFVRQLRQTYPDALYIFTRADTLYTGRAATVHVVHARLTGAPERNPDFALSSAPTRLVLRRFRLGPGERTRTTAERLARLALNTNALTAAEVTARCDDAFNKEALTQDFFKRLSHHLGALEKDLLDAAGLKATDTDKKEAFTQAQLLLERLIFLYFAQNRGWLDQRIDWFMHAFAPHRGRPRDASFYSDCLRLLFRSLARSDFPGRLDGVPFLNGGLFDEDDFETTATALPVRNQTFLELFDDLLEAYNFTVREDTPLAQEVAVDPEMLGKVFESIVLHAESAGDEYQAPDKRKATGSYYTPRIVVHFICREALRLWFTSHAAELADPARASDWELRVTALFLDLEPADGRLSDLAIAALRKLISPAEAARCLERLRKLRTLDPSVGSGAFPVGLLHELVALHQIFEAAANGYKDPATATGRAWRQKTKAHYIEHALFGVDLQQQAVEICRLRLWLSLLVDYELEVDPLEGIDRTRFLEAIRRVSQLPNLEMNFKRGDSLFDHLCGRPVTLPSQPSHAFADALQSIEKLGLELHHSTSAQRKRSLRLEILRQRYTLSRFVLQEQEQTFREQLASFDDFFGGSDRDRKDRDRVKSGLDQLRDAQTQLAREQKDFEALLARGGGKPTAAFYRMLRRLEGAEMDGPHNFAWQIDFPHVLAGDKPKATLAGELTLVNEAQTQQELAPSAPSHTDGGFDLLLGNPPFVTARNKEKNELYRQRWPRVCRGKYLLICPFFELSFGLLRPGGQLGFIVSNAFAKREFGEPLVEDFFPTVHLQKLVDCSGLMFPGHGTPTVITFGRRPTDENDLAWKNLPIRNIATLAGGGDLRSDPESSELWHAIEAHHEQGQVISLSSDERKVGFRKYYENARIAVGDCDRSEMLSHPCIWTFFDWPAFDVLSSSATVMLRDVLGADVGFDAITAANDIYFVDAGVFRRNGIAQQFTKPLLVGELVRNYECDADTSILWPYAGKTCEPTISAEMERFLKPQKEFLSVRSQFRKTQLQAGLTWFEYREYHRRALRPQLTFAKIATHLHFTFSAGQTVFNEHAPIIELPLKSPVAHYHLLAALLNSSSALFWLKQVCFNKGAGDDEEKDRFEFAGGKIERLPVSTPVADALAGKADVLATRLADLAEQTWTRGQELPSLALKKIFEKRGEAYHTWNVTLPGNVAPHRLLSQPFTTAATLRDALSRTTSRREQLRAEMVARQEEMDWICYQTYGLLAKAKHTLIEELEAADLTLLREQRPCTLWAVTGGDYEKAAALVPREWSTAKKCLWRARLACIRDNEHIRRLEQPVYKRRWDEQWKVGNRWECGPAAYAAELSDAFAWWLSEKAEWHLEHAPKGDPHNLDGWAAALWSDVRVHTAWSVVADALAQLEHHKTVRKNTAEGDLAATTKPAKADFPAFGKYFRDLMKEQSVPIGIPAGADWGDLLTENKFTSAQLSAAKKLRGPLNVPRERFHQRADGTYLWAGLKISATPAKLGKKPSDKAVQHFRLPVAQRPAAVADVYLLSLIPELLTQAANRLAWDEFVQAMSFLGRPHLMEAHALPETLAAVQAWRARGTQLFAMSDVIPALLKLGRHNLGIAGQELIWKGNSLAQHDPDFAYDAQLALKIVRDLSVAVSFDAEATTLDNSFSSFEAQLASA